MLKWAAAILLVTLVVAENPAFKYSREANENVQEKSSEASDHHHHGASPHHHHDHSGHSGCSGHSHGHPHGAHGGHGHSHGAHGGHGHSHGAHHHSYEAHEAHGHSHEAPSVKGSSEEISSIWLKAIGSALLISLVPFLILIFIPISEKSGHENNLKVLLSFASGGLLGDAFLHLIPHAMSPHSHDDHDHSHDSSEGGHHHDNSVGFSVLLGIFAFLMVEKFVRMVKGDHSHSHGDHSAVKEKKQAKAKSEKEKQQGDDKSERKTNLEKTPHKPDVKVAAYLNLAADFAHNFTDGLAIGASFLAGNTAGIVSTFTILLHEVPHEIGDFAILVQSGMSKRKAMLMQLVTAVGCLSGTIVSLLAEGVGAANWVLPFTAGGFIYIATVSVIPELLENSQFWQSVKEIFALACGVGMMMYLTEFE